MQFNGDANDNDICSLADQLVKTTDVNFSLAKKALYANIGLRKITREINKVYAGAIYDDANNSGEPQTSVNLVVGTKFYTFATAQIINAVDWTDANGNSFPLIPITLEEIREKGYAEVEFEEANGSPTYYRLVKNGIKIYPASDTGITNGLTAYHGRDVTAFTAASTTATPGYDSLAGHEAVAIFMAMLYAKLNIMDSYKGLYEEWIDALLDIRRHYRDKMMRDKKPAIKKGSYANEMM